MKPHLLVSVYQSEPLPSRASSEFKGIIMKTICSLLLLLIAVVTVFAQEESSGSKALNLTIGNTGISFGNAPRVNGIRINWSDSDLEEVNGINFTLWKASEKNPSGDINGLALGIVSPSADRIRGIALTPGAVLTGTSMEGVNLAGLALVSQGSVSGINVAGLAVVGQDDITGLNLTLLGLVSQGSITGISFGGLATVSQRSMNGFGFGGLATIAQGDVNGFSIGGLATVAQGDVTGFSFGGLATVAHGAVTGITVGGLATVAQGGVSGFSLGGLAVVGQEDISGISVGGVAVVGEKSISGITGTLGQIQTKGSVSGLNVAGYKIDARTVKGANITAIWTETENIGYFTVGAYNRTYDTQTGLTIGLLNHAHNLAGIQIGLMNIVETNPEGLRYLPILNVKF